MGNKKAGSIIQLMLSEIKMVTSVAPILLHRLANYWHDFAVHFAFIRSTTSVPLDNLFVFDDS